MSRATFPKLGYDAPFAGITEEVDQLLRGLIPAAGALWRELRRTAPPGAVIEFNLHDLAGKLKYSVRWLCKAFKELIKSGLLESDRRSWEYWFRARVIDPGIVQKNSSDRDKNGKKQPSNPDSLVTYSLKDIKEELTTKEESFANSPKQKEGIRSNPAPKLKSQNQEPNPELGTEPTIEALGLIAEYGVKCGSPKLASKKPVQQAIANIARNSSPEEIQQRVRNAIAATEQQRLKGGVKCLEALLSAAIIKGHTLNIPKAAAIPVSPPPSAVIAGLAAWIWEVNQSFPNSIYEIDRQGVATIYRRSDQSPLGTFEELRDLPIEEIGQLVNAPSENVKMGRSPIPLSPFPTPTKTPPVVSKPSEDEVITARALIPAYEEERGIIRSDRPSAISKLIGVTANGLTRLDETQLIQYLQALQKPEPPE